MRLPSSLRIKASRDFARVRKEGASVPGRFLVLAVVKGLAEDGFKFGLITPKKIGVAVVRSQVRRRLREIVRAHQQRITGGCHFVIIARWKAPQADYHALEKDWLRLATRAALLKDPPAAP